MQKKAFPSVILLTILFSAFQSYSQPTDFLFPINPGTRNYLAGSMGEIRSNHFHAGIDIKTGGRIGLPVKASADGYVYRVRVSPSGYGKVIYMQHANNRRTVYAHLHDFDGPLAQWVLERQYAIESFKVDLRPEPDQFRYSKGDVIGLSGNTGSSAGPHLHFEIRDNQDVALNPLKYGFQEIRDNRSPVPYRIALKAFSPTASINGRLGRIEKSVFRSGKTYRIAGNIHATGLLGLEFQASDKADGTYNSYGINHVELFLDDRKIYEHMVDEVPFETTRFINIFKDFEQWNENRKAFQKCYEADGNRLPFYDQSPTKGLFCIPEDNQPHAVLLRLTDEFGNSSEIVFQIVGSDKTTGKELPAMPKEELFAGNFYTWQGGKPRATVHAGYFSQTVDADFQENGQYYFFWDLRTALPDSIQYDEKTWCPGYESKIFPCAPTTFYGESATVHVPAEALGDTLYWKINMDSSMFTMGDPFVPLMSHITVRLKNLPETIKNEKLEVFQVEKGGDLDYIGGRWDGNDLIFRTRSFGKFQFSKDKSPPKIRVISRSPWQLKVWIDDNQSGIDHYRILLDGEWLMMAYDPRKKILVSERLDKKKAMKGDVFIQVTDRAGNTREYRTSL